MCMGLLLQPIACFSKFFCELMLMTVFCHALANLPIKANIDRIYLELVTQNLKEISTKIQKYSRDQIQSKHSYENWFNPNW